MTDVQKRKAAAKFAESWQGRGYEKGEAQVFWYELLRDVYDVDNPNSYIKFEDPIKLVNIGYIDGYISATKVIIEQKKLGINLGKKDSQTGFTPFEQAERYSHKLSYSGRPRWIVTCNFSEFWIYDMEYPNNPPEKVLLVDLSKEYYRLNFLADPTSEKIKKEKQISLQAGEIVGALYDEILKQYKTPDDLETLRDLNILCVRLVFCLYAEDAGIFGGRTQFRDYIRNVANNNVEDVREALQNLFDVLNQEEKARSPYLKSALAAFPYVNGGLFDGRKIEIPLFNKKIVDLLIQDAADGFYWSGISPTIFGAVFESTLNPVTRRSGGMHYTSIENIHKVIDPLFLDGLKAELDEIKEKKQVNVKLKNLSAFQRKLSNLKFLDPACGSGNFLTETYLSLRRLENEVLSLLYGEGQLTFEGDIDMIIKVSIEQFYGIEINDFAVSVAKTALWIAESQMLKETEIIINKDLNFLPLKSYANIIEGNALRIDWEEVVPKSELSYIMGNPPFINYKDQSSEQKKDVAVFTKAKCLDYVAMWYFKATAYIQGATIKCAFVSTNSIAQGEQPVALWKPLFNRGVHINFAVESFKWGNESKDNALVYCVIIGFSGEESENNLNPYLLNAPTVFIERRSKPLCAVPQIIKGSIGGDDGALIIEKKDYESVYSEQTAKFIRKFIGGDELIKNTHRYCLWLKDAQPNEIRSSKFIQERIQRCKGFREESGRPQTKKLAETPYLFGEIRQPDVRMLVIPKVSGGNRKYIPMKFIEPDVIVNGSALILPGATLYHFGVLTSFVHMAWTRTVCGWYGPSYQYSSTIVYNNFPWIDVSDKQQNEIKVLAQNILETRKPFEDNGNSLADLYDVNAMPANLLKAHDVLDRAVVRLYGFSPNATESEVVAGLMERYQKLTGGTDNVR